MVRGSSCALRRWARINEMGWTRASCYIAENVSRQMPDTTLLSHRLVSAKQCEDGSEAKTDDVQQQTGIA
jgi:hypothetical protein